MDGVIKFYDLAPRASSTHYFSPNTWKTRMSLLHKGVKFETISATLLDFRGDLARRSNQRHISAPAIELPDGTFIYDSFRIAEWLENAYPNAPSLFTGDGKLSCDAWPEHINLGKNYARMIDLGLGASKPEWAVWFDLFFPQLDKIITGEEHRAYFISDARHGPQGYQKLLSLDCQELMRRAKMNIQPLVQILRERPNEYFQGTHPGQVDYVIFGRYAYCRMLDTKLTREIWNDQGEELNTWIKKLSQAYDGHAQQLFDSVYVIN
ncbi:unnamed protein product [Rotaria sp. Silwood2]|nr:unnamed protein product [Rotaria sp. Silwood2]CAF3197164.1 unnamed protein product [Rotaria sp. Silwood2]CAF4281378.1 unnamed protein product [Rotaria sp. Silwood2]CAF4629497.1 unnamed protein product [Rotaria sp. Silwood2]